MPEMVTEEDAQYALDIITRICTQAGPGLPATPQERTRAALLQQELAAHLGAEQVTVEEFTLAPRAFLGSLPIAALSSLVAVLLYIFTGRFLGISPWSTTLPALAFSTFSLLLVILEFTLGREFIDPFFPKQQSVNVVGALRPREAKEVRRLLILSGHHDSAPENTWLRLLGYGFLPASALMFAGLIALFAMSLLQVAGLLTGRAEIDRLETVEWGLVTFLILPSIILMMFFTRGWKNGGKVPGAVDNLSACALSVAMCRFPVRNPACLPENTEIRFISFGSEEAAVRGSRRYVSCHLEELKNLDVRVLNFEMVAYPEITILATDANGTVKNSPQMVNSVAAAGERAGVPYRVQSSFFGGPGTDAAPFSQAGLKALTLLPFKMPQQMIAFYHQDRDRPEVLTLEPFLNVLELSLEWIRCGGE